MNADGSRLRQLTSGPAPEFDPTWSPDGTAIAYRVDRATSADIYLMDADGSDQRKLVTGLSPAWSPDGSRIAYADASGSISTIKPDGSDARTVPDTDQGEYPSWAPDSKRFAYSTGTAPHVIFAVNVDGSDRRQLTEGKSTDWQVDWSPDGARIVFSSNRSGGSGGLFMMDANGSNEMPFTTDGGFTAAWSPDGSQLVYSTGHLRVISADGSCAADLPAPGAGEAGTPDWIP